MKIRRRDLLFAFVILLVFWQAAAMLVDRNILPDPLRVVVVFWKNFEEGLAEWGKISASIRPELLLARETAFDEFSRLANAYMGGTTLFHHFIVSLWRVLAGTALAILTAAPAGLVIGQSKRLNRLFAPLIYLVYPVPKVVFTPIILLFFGLGDLSKIVIIFIILFFQILVLVRDQAANLRPELIQSVRSLGAGRRALFRFVYLPASLPAILTALRQSIGTAVAVLYIAEMSATRLGLGQYIYLQGSTLFNYPAMYAGVVSMSLLGLGMYFGVDWLERRLCPWMTPEQT
jgi:ABC-type nitrate/sulfonate/bicarbonate transport system permease component